MLRKYWKIILIVLLFLLLTTSIVLLVITRKQLKQNEKIASEYKLYVDEKLDEINESNQKLIASNDSLISEMKKSNVIILTKETKYETVKKSATNKVYTDAQLTEWLNSYRSIDTSRGRRIKTN